MNEKMNVKFQTIDIQMLDDESYRNDICKSLRESSTDFLVLNYINNEISSSTLDDLKKKLSLIASATKTAIISGLLHVIAKDSDLELSFYINESGVLQGTESKDYDKNCLSHITKFNVYESKFGKIGLILSKDIWSIEIPRILVLKGAIALFVLDCKQLSKECEISYIRGISVYNCVPIIYTQQQNEKTSIFVSSPKAMVFEDQYTMTETKDSMVDIDEIVKMRVPDLSFHNTLWWVLWGRKPENYRELLEF